MIQLRSLNYMDDLILRDTKTSRCIAKVKRHGHHRNITYMRNKGLKSTSSPSPGRSYRKLVTPCKMTVENKWLLNVASIKEGNFSKRYRISNAAPLETVIKKRRKKKRTELSQVNWSEVPTEALVHVFSKLSLKDVGRSAQVCRSWHYASQFAELWQHFEFVIGPSDLSFNQPTSPGLINHIINHHSNHLKFVVFKTDSSAQSIQLTCQILSKLVNCQLRTLTLVSSKNSSSLDHVDHTSFAAALTLLLNQSSRILQSLAIDATPVDDQSLQALVAASSLRSLQLVQMKGLSHITPQGILTVVSHCHHLRELSISWPLLSDALVKALSSKKHTSLEYLRVDVHSWYCYCPQLESSNIASEMWKPPSAECWRALVEHSPSLVLVIQFFDKDGATEEVISPQYQEIYAPLQSFFASYIPVTHLYFGDVAPRSILAKVAQYCPRLQELVAAGVGSRYSDGSLENGDHSGSLLDAELLAMAAGCPQLVSVGLGECEVSCGALVEFAGRLGPQLSRLCVKEDSLVEEGEVDIETTCKLVSNLIGRDWSPEFSPLW
ncbi:hypothetical protein J437_LFUL018773 [Ladona fulva]|nr:hypothetical protein J437_LFUL018773 [Ladona fulva]